MVPSECDLVGSILFSREKELFSIRQWTKVDVRSRFLVVGFVFSRLFFVFFLNDRFLFSERAGFRFFNSPFSFLNYRFDKDRCFLYG